jgi:hypothetical protein
MFRTILNKLVEQVVAELDADGDGKFTVEDLRRAAIKVEDSLRAKQTNWLHGSIAASISFLVGIVVAKVFL